MSPTISMETAKEKLTDLYHKAPDNIIIPFIVIFFTVILFLRNKIIN